VTVTVDFFQELLGKYVSYRLDSWAYAEPGTGSLRSKAGKIGDVAP
jgi:hypothetical protein